MFHNPVLLAETVVALSLRPGANVIDATVGGGGHAEAILRATAPDGKLIGLDLDPAAIVEARKRLKPFQKRAYLFQNNFTECQRLRDEQFPNLPIHAILLDLGVSSFELADHTRGFSFLTPDAPLDMRYGHPINHSTSARGGSGTRFSAEGQTAADLLNTASREELYQILSEYGQEITTIKLVDALLQQRQKQKFSVVGDLLAAVLRVYIKKLHSHTHQPWLGQRHPATKVFQALRIAVNDELNNLKRVLPRALGLLETAGRLAVISFHSLEDQIVKYFLRRESRDCLCPPETPVCCCGHKAQLRLITKKAIRPSHDELKANPRSRSAHLRVAEKI